jgi:hypothetical protein
LSWWTSIKPPRILWQISKEKNQKEVVGAPCVPIIDGWEIQFLGKEFPIGEMTINLNHIGKQSESL